MVPTDGVRDSELPPTTGDTLPSSTTEDGPRGAVPYSVGELLGKGGMGEVVLARDERIGRDVALKRMRAGETDDQTTSRFLREAKIQARLDHPAIVPVHEVGRDSAGRPYFTMKRVTGTTFAALLESGDATTQRLLRALVDVCQAIQLAHARQVVHRDLKPQNIMLGDYGEVYVLDWGLARLLGEADTPSQRGPGDSMDGTTQAGALLGTPGYMAPEQVRGDRLGTPADVYALGSMLFETLAGEPLHPRGPKALASTIDEELELSPAKRVPTRTIPPELDAACMAALADDPDARPTVRELGDRIQRYLDGDRDLDRRRALALEQLALARAALSSGDPAKRSDAVHAAGRALALDPDSHEAADLVVSLIVEPPAKLPPELEREVQANEVRSTRKRSGRAVLPYLSFYVITPFLAFVEIRNWAVLVAMYMILTVMAGLAWINKTRGGIPIWVMLAANLSIGILFTRFASPLVLTPMLLGILTVSATAMPWLTRRRWASVVYAVLVVTTPFVLEWLGVFARTFGLLPEGVFVHGTVFGTGTPGYLWLLLFANLAIAIVAALYTRVLARDRHDAERRLHIQAWHLQQLLPKRANVPALAA